MAHLKKIGLQSAEKFINFVNLVNRFHQLVHTRVAYSE